MNDRPMLPTTPPAPPIPQMREEVQVLPKALLDRLIPLEQLHAQIEGQKNSLIAGFMLGVGHEEGVGWTLDFEKGIARRMVPVTDQAETADEAAP